MTDQHGFLTGQGREQPRPGWSIDKFDDHGRVRATPGLTTLCHIDQESAGFAALVQAQQALRAGPHAGAFAFLPQDSLHMTVFDGVIDYRRGPGEWPAHLPADAPMAAVEADWRARLQAFTGPRDIAIRATGLTGGFTVAVTGATVRDEARLRAARDTLAATLGLRRANHDSYRFHITLAYQIRWLSDAAARAVVALSQDSFADVADRLQAIGFGRVEFCRFDTMHRFDPICLL